MAAPPDQFIALQAIDSKRQFRDKIFCFNNHVCLVVSGFRDCPYCCGSCRIVGSGHVPCILLCKVNNPKYYLESELFPCSELFLCDW